MTTCGSTSVVANKAGADLLVCETRRFNVTAVRRKREVAGNMGVGSRRRPDGVDWMVLCGCRNYEAAGSLCLLAAVVQLGPVILT